MHKAMLSQPMGGKTQEEIVETRERAAYFCRGLGTGSRLSHRT